MQLAATEITGRAAKRRLQLFSGCGCLEIRASPVAKIFVNQRATRIFQ